jgi:ribose/xylose/arabinose/galactoside ABC-type transport system permease subunit
MKRFLAKHSPLLILAALCMVLALASADFRDPRNLQQVALRTCAVGLIAIGQILVILTAGIDLSVGSVAAVAAICSGVAMTKLMAFTQRLTEAQLADSAAQAAWWVGLVEWSIIPAGIALSCLVGLLCGLVNGLLVTKGRIPPFIATLSGMMVYRGMVLLITGGTTVFGLPLGLKYLGGAARIGDGTTWWIPVSITALLAAAFAVLLTFTRFGRALFATGGNLSAARLSGINIDRVRLGAYSLCGLLSGLAGIILMARVSVGAPNMAEGMELAVIAACVIGGASLMGGEGGVLGAIAGALIMSVLVNFCNLNDINPHWQKIFVGALIAILVYYDTSRKRRAGLLKE